VATVLDPGAPDGWPARVLAGLQSLAQLDHGTLLVRPDTVEVAGVSGSQQASARISQLLSEGLGQGKTFKVNVSYDKELDPLAALPTPMECLARVVAVVAERKISFDPGSAELDAASGAVLDNLAKALKGCKAVRMEIGGHTDAQGSEDGNLALSQARAEAVLVALQGRQVDVSGMRALGYGEGVPIEDNGDEEGREANRRIAFTLIEDAAAVAGPPGSGSGVPGDEPAAGAAADVSADDGPSFAPVEKTERPKPRPKG
jgi:OOP family OmpA-OmpF porin